jgi:hypothetical protein
MARPTLYDRSRALIDDWQSGVSAPATHTDRLLLAEIFRLTGLETCQLPYPLRRSVVLQKMIESGMSYVPGESWFEVSIEATTYAIVDFSPPSAPNNVGRPRSALLLDLLTTGAYFRGVTRCPPRASRRRMQIEAARCLGINHNRVRHALIRTSVAGRELGPLRGAVSLASLLLTDLVARGVVPEHGTGQRWPGTLDHQSPRP